MRGCVALLKQVLEHIMLAATDATDATTHADGPGAGAAAAAVAGMAAAGGGAEASLPPPPQQVVAGVSAAATVATACPDLMPHVPVVRMLWHPTVNIVRPPPVSELAGNSRINTHSGGNSCSSNNSDNNSDANRATRVSGGSGGAGGAGSAGERGAGNAAGDSGAVAPESPSPPLAPALRLACELCVELLHHGREMVKDLRATMDTEIQMETQMRYKSQVVLRLPQVALLGKLLPVLVPAAHALCSSGPVAVAATLLTPVGKWMRG